MTIGYTFHARMNYGFCFDVGRIYKYADNTRVRYGLSFNQYYVVTKKYTHRLRSISIMGQTDFVDIKIGFGRARNKWGRGNRCITRGINYDISFATPSIYSPWIGFRRFKYTPSNWAWFLYPYNSVYLKYSFDLIQNTPLKDENFK